VRFQRSTAWLLVALFVFATSTPWHAVDIIDGDALVLHDASAHHVRAGHSAPAPEHCAVCHWLHSLQTVTIGNVAAAYDANGSRLTDRRPPARPSGFALVHLPPRSPPA